MVLMVPSLVLVVVGLVLGSALADVAGTEPPNIVFVLMDDVGYK
jgi:hypothetical protein